MANITPPTGGICITNHLSLTALIMSSDVLGFGFKFVSLLCCQVHLIVTSLIPVRVSAFTRLFLADDLKRF